MKKCLLYPTLTGALLTLAGGSCSGAARAGAAPDMRACEAAPAAAATLRRSSRSAATLSDLARVRV